MSTFIKREAISGCLPRDSIIRNLHIHLEMRVQVKESSQRMRFWLTTKTDSGVMVPILTHGLEWLVIFSVFEIIDSVHSVENWFHVENQMYETDFNPS